MLSDPVAILRRYIDPVSLRLPVLVLPLFIALLASACEESPEPGQQVEATVDAHGLITSIRPGSAPGSGTVRVEGPPRPEVRYNKADVAILASTQIIARTGAGDRPARFADLELGDRIEVKFDSAVSKSWPVRAVALDIFILQKVRGFAPGAPPLPTPTPPAPMTSDLLGTEPEPEPVDPLDELPEPLPEEPPQEAPQVVPGTVILREVRTGDQPTFDRVVFEFQGAKLPDYDVKYVRNPVHCGSGLPVEVDGSVYLQVRFTPAQAHNEAGASTVPFLQRKVRLPVVKEVRATCDFEADVTWVVGLAARKEYRVMELEGPPRLVIDIER